jgi:hypothetical protein
MITDNWKLATDNLIMTDELLPYPQLIDQAMRDVVREVLRRVSGSGLPGDHHFYISFSTTHPGVKMSDQLRARYLKDITIVLQHQFWDFHVEDLRFHVTLSFGGIPEKLSVPFAALTAFADPSVKFGLQFQHLAPQSSAESDANPQLAFEEPITMESENDEPDAEKVISLEAFRKK